MFGDKLKALREEAKMTQAELANLIKISTSAVGMYEQNRRKPDYDLLQSIADHFDVTVDFLLSETEKINAGYGLNRIKELRVKNNMSQDDLADKVHLKRSIISKYESGIIPLTDKLIIELANLFSVSSDYLLGNSETPNPTGIVVKVNPGDKFADLDKLPEEEQKKIIEYYEMIVAKHLGNKRDRD